MPKFLINKLQLIQVLNILLYYLYYTLHYYIIKRWKKILRTLPWRGYRLLDGGMCQIQSVLCPGNPGKDNAIRVRSGQLEDDVWKQDGSSVHATSAARWSSTLRSCTRCSLACRTGKLTTGRKFYKVCQGLIKNYNNKKST